MNEERKGLGVWQIISSAVASFIGVQSEEKRRRDFSQGRPRDFILAGLIFTALFILVVYGVVKLVMSLAGV